MRKLAKTTVYTPLLTNYSLSPADEEAWLGAAVLLVVCEEHGVTWSKDGRAEL